jgi:hypothetical protein
MYINKFNAARAVVVNHGEYVLNEKKRILTEMGEVAQRHLDKVYAFKVDPQIKKPFIEHATAMAEAVKRDTLKLQQRFHMLETFKKIDAAGVGFNSLKLSDGCVIKDVESALFGLTHTFRPVYFSVAHTADGLYAYAVVDTVCAPVVLHSARISGTPSQMVEEVERAIKLISSVSMATFDTLAECQPD